MSDNIQANTISSRPKIDIKKLYENMEVIDSGIIHTYNSNDIIITVNSVKIIFKFVTDEEALDLKSTIDVGVDKSQVNTLIIKLINFKSPDPEGAPKPLNIASVGTKQVFISFFVETINREKGVRSFSYTLMAEE